MTPLDIVFAGSPAAAVPSLEALAASAHRVRTVITRRDSPQGRKRVVTATPVADAAERLRLDVIRADRLAGEATDAVAGIRPDLGVIVAYGGLVREPLLALPRLGWINLHFSLLPRWRGAAPVQHAVIAGDEVTGAAVFQLVPELDAGAVFDTISRRIGGNETSGHLLDVLAVDGASLLVRVVDSLADGTAVARRQEGTPTLAPKITIDDARIDWSRDAAAVHDRIRGVTPEPGAFTLLGGLRLKVLDAVVARETAARPPGSFDTDGGRVLVGTATEPIELLTVQPAGGRPTRATDWWRGRSADAATAADRQGQA